LNQENTKVIKGRLKRAPLRRDIVFSNFTHRMTICFLSVLRALVVFLAPLAMASTEEEKLAALPRGTSVIDSRGIESFELLGGDATAKFVEVEGQPFTKAARLRTLKRPEHNYSLQFHARTTEPVKKGDILVAVFSARSVGAPGQSSIVFELDRAPYTKSADYPFKLNTTWRRFYVPITAALDQPVGNAHITFRLGYDPQTIEIGGLQVLNYAAGIARELLPYTPATYEGREPDAPWRKSAAGRIERLRKGDLTVRVIDGKGKPVSGAKVRARMKRHTFGWGSAVDAKTLLGDDSDNERYRQHILQNYNRVVLENDLKWAPWMGDRQPALGAIKWLRERGIDVRGHCLVWPGKENLPDSIDALLERPVELVDAIHAHIRDEATALRGQLIDWDVVNEPFTNFDVQAAVTGLKRNASADWIERHANVLSPLFRTAREADPVAKLYLNDYSILETGGADAPHQDHFERTLRQLLADKAPLDGIGIQGHFSGDLTDIPRLWEILDRYGKLGLPIQITEFDINTYDEQLAGDYTRDFLTAMFAHESVVAVLTWGFWEKRHWIPNGSLLRADWSPRPSGSEWERLVRKEWWTDVEVDTDASGTAKIRGFHGEYDIACGDVRATATLERSGAAVTIRGRSN
jgi:endo-1,4-beta-xylanase